MRLLELLQLERTELALQREVEEGLQPVAELLVEEVLLPVAELLVEEVLLPVAVQEAELDLAFQMHPILLHYSVFFYT